MMAPLTPGDPVRRALAPGAPNCAAPVSMPAAARGTCGEVRMVVGAVAGELRGAACMPMMCMPPKGGTCQTREESVAVLRRDGGARVWACAAVGGAWAWAVVENIGMGSGGEASGWAVVERHWGGPWWRGIGVGCGGEASGWAVVERHRHGLGPRRPSHREPLQIILEVILRSRSTKRRVTGRRGEGRCSRLRRLRRRQRGRASGGADGDGARRRGVREVRRRRGRLGLEVLMTVLMTDD